MRVVDTNIVAYFLMEGGHSAAARQLHSLDPDWRSEAFLLVEFTNVLASSIAAKRMTFSQAGDFLANATVLFAGKLPHVSHELVLTTALQYRISAHDARFLALALQLNTPLVTEDAKLRAAAPKLTQSLGEALAVA
jgi:predicted nucleic acid-binding protein